MKKRLMVMLEKLLPARYWTRAPKLNDAQYWEAFAGTPTLQTLAVLHEAQTQFNEYMQNAADTKASSEEHRQFFDKAMALAQFVQTIEERFETAKTEVQRRAALAAAAAQGGNK